MKRKIYFMRYRRKKGKRKVGKNRRRKIFFAEERKNGEGKGGKYLEK